MLAVISPLMRTIDIPMTGLQRLMRLKNPAWLFLAPNLVLFGLFAFLPVAVNVLYAVTGGDAILLENRPNVGTPNFATLLDCQSYLDPNSCNQEFFWRAVYNTIWFVTLQVGSMVLFSLIPA